MPGARRFVIADDAADLAFGASSFFDLDHLATAIEAAVRADVVGLPGLAAVRALGQGDDSDAVMAPPVPLACARDSLLRKCTHVEKVLSVPVPR